MLALNTFRAWFFSVKAIKAEYQSVKCADFSQLVNILYLGVGVLMLSG